MKRKMLSLAAALALGGCSLIPEYQRPQTNIPTTWPQGAAYAASPQADDAAVQAW